MDRPLVAKKNAPLKSAGRCAKNATRLLAAGGGVGGRRGFRLFIAVRQTGGSQLVLVLLRHGRFFVLVELAVMVGVVFGQHISLELFLFRSQLVRLGGILGLHDKGGGAAERDGGDDQFFHVINIGCVVVRASTRGLPSQTPTRLLGYKNQVQPAKSKSGQLMK